MNPLALLVAHLEFRRNQRRTRAEIEARQLAKFRRLMAYVVPRAAYYRDIVADRRIDLATCRPSDFPELTKPILMANFDRIVTDPAITRAGISAFLERSRDPRELYLKRYTVQHSSGTSGHVGYAVFSSWEVGRAMAQALRVNCAPRLARRRMAFYGASKGHFAGISMVSSSQTGLQSLAYDLSVFDISEPIGPVVEALNRAQPEILLGYASSLAMLAEMQRQGRLRVKPAFVQCSAEPVNPADRARIETAFGVPLINVYSCTEHFFLGFSRPEFDGMYLCEDDLIFDLRDTHTLVTNLFNRTLPLIRYRMDDRLVPKKDTVGLYPFTKIDEVVGRNEQIPIFTNRDGLDDFVHPALIGEFLVAGIYRVQLQVRSKTACTLRVCLEAGIEATQRTQALAAAQRRLAEVFRDRQMENVEFTIEERADLPPDPRTNKFKLVVGADG